MNNLIKNKIWNVFKIKDLLYKEEDLPQIKKLNEKGINYIARDYKKDRWIEANNPTAKKQSKVDLEEKQIVKTL
jgi:hypothetical protein